MEIIAEMMVHVLVQSHVMEDDYVNDVIFYGDNKDRIYQDLLINTATT